MDSDSRFAQLVSFVAHCQGSDPQRLQSLVFLAQAFGEPFNYSYDVHHFRVFSLSLERDVESLKNQAQTSKGNISEICAFITGDIGQRPLEHIEYAAAYVYFEKKGYTATDITKTLNPSDEVARGAKELLSLLTSAGSKSLAASGAR